MKPGEDDHLDRWVIRHVHGELSEAEAADFDRAMNSDPALRELHASYARLDGLTADALLAFTEREPACEPPFAEAPAHPARVRGTWLASRWTLPIAVAASLALAMVIPIGPDDADPRQGPRTAQTGGNGTSATGPALRAPSGPLTHLVGTGPSAAQRNTARDVIAVMGEDGNTVYVIEVERTRLTRVLSEGTRSRVLENGF
ncbi:MAG: hypothetical protein C4547_01100 [Phycisphaerales bacterium]|nr:MAG: hypothetical protein C4547_01100 [Phycisphaerales bacterium]